MDQRQEKPSIATLYVDVRKELDRQRRDMERARENANRASEAAAKLEKELAATVSADDPVWIFSVSSDAVVVVSIGRCGPSSVTLKRLEK